MRRWAQTGDPRVRTRAIQEYMPLARRLAKRVHRGREPLDDLQQVAYVGLVKAVDRFDPRAGARFASFAIPTITGELRRHFRDTTWSVHVPRGVQEDTLRIRKATEELSERLQRAPTIAEVGDETGLGLEQVLEAMQAGAAKDTSSLDSPLSSSEEGDTTLGDTLGRADDGFGLAEDRTAVAGLLRALPERERRVLMFRFAFDMTQSEIAMRMGCSQMQISRILRRTLERLSAAGEAGADASPSVALGS